jgi:hypothetical protein
MMELNRSVKRQLLSTFGTLAVASGTVSKVDSWWSIISTCTLVRYKRTETFSLIAKVRTHEQMTSAAVLLFQ